MKDQWIVTEEAHRADIASGGHGSGDMVGTSDKTRCGDGIHERDRGSLKRCFAPQGGLRFVGRAVGDH